jgi:RND family efflux transporter MFP subunit
VVSLPVERPVTDYVEFPGRTEALHTVEVRSHVTGYLDRIHFTEGEEIKEGALLFEIDPRPYEAELARAEANVVQAEARAKRMEADYQRVLKLLQNNAIAQQEFDTVAGERAESVANVGVAKANRRLAETNLSYTKIRSTINGRISRRFVDPGNLVKADETPLTVIVTQDPIYAYFDIDERTTLQVQRLMRAGKLSWSSANKDQESKAASQGSEKKPDGAKPPQNAPTAMKVQLGLADEEGVSREGIVNFADNRIDSDSGTWRLRGVFANADRVLSPGMFVRIRLLLGEPHPALMIAEQALGTDQGQKFVYVIKKKTKPNSSAVEIDPHTQKPVEIAEYRRVKVGRLQNGLRVISDGLAKDEQVVVSGLQRIRPKDPTVTTKLVPMPEVKPETRNGKPEPNPKPEPSKPN